MPFPQIIFFHETEIQFITNEANNKVSLEYIILELKSLYSLHIDNWIVDRRPQNLPEVQPAIIRSAPNHYLIRASSQEDVDYIKSGIFEGTLFNAISAEVEGLRHTLQPAPVYSRIVINVGHINRALAKSALNFLCAAIGPELARDECFSELRNFIMTEYSAPQSEFVRPLWGLEKEKRWYDLSRKFSKEGCHTLILSEVDKALYVFFLLYARPFAVVRLLRESHTSVLGAEKTRIAFFDYKLKMHSLLTWGDWLMTHSS